MAFVEMGSQITPPSFQLHLSVVSKVHFAAQVLFVLCRKGQYKLKMEGDEVVLLLNHTVCNL